MNPLHCPSFNFMETLQKLALITGANRGLGFEIARQLAQKGITVLLGARNEGAGNDAVTRLTSQGYTAHFLLLDIDDTASIANAVAEVTTKFGKLDILVNNAAILPRRDGTVHSPSGVSQDVLNTFLQTNFLSQVAVTQAFLPLVKLSTAGRIVNMSSSIGSVTITSEPLHKNGPKPATLAYAASKAALNMFTVTLAKELAETTVKVNSIDPGLTQTEAAPPNVGDNSMEQGARPAVWAACLDEDGPTGSFFTHHLQHLVTNPW
jgi:NAD(P)-dependent dehydrogenase (short-subunit alcohol dehydrogenase family)